MDLAFDTANTGFGVGVFMLIVIAVLAVYAVLALTTAAEVRALRSEVVLLRSLAGLKKAAEPEVGVAHQPPTTTIADTARNPKLDWLKGVE